jgi:hypothetical protein
MASGYSGGDLTVSTPALHPSHGPHEPSSGSPPRAPGSIRRTSTIDTLRPDGIEGDLVIAARARDLLTDAGGTSVVLGEASVAARIDYFHGSRLLDLETTPEAAGTAALVGLRVSGGFRKALVQHLAEHRAAASLLHLLLDDLPGAVLVSAYAVGREGVHPRAPGEARLQVADLCAGWRTGGTILVEEERTGSHPIVTGPAAPSLGRADDPSAWHATIPLSAHGMRRARRVDVRVERVIAVDALFRDSHMSAEGEETVIHEYTLRATIDPDSNRFLDVDVTPQVLPWVECPAAVGSASRLIGAEAADLRQSVRLDFVGPSTCTHLNDTIRSLDDVGALRAAL